MISATACSTDTHQQGAAVYGILRSPGRVVATPYSLVSLCSASHSGVQSFLSHLAGCFCSVGRPGGFLPVFPVVDSHRLQRAGSDDLRTLNASSSPGCRWWRTRRAAEWNLWRTSTSCTSCTSFIIFHLLHLLQLPHHLPPPAPPAPPPPPSSSSKYSSTSCTSSIIPHCQNTVMLPRALTLMPSPSPHCTSSVLLLDHRRNTH